jgi:DNA-binding response OmpR family regulator
MAPERISSDAIQSNVGSRISNFCHQTILLVDDEELILPEYQEFLEFKGFVALIAKDPEQAFITVMERSDIGVVVTDLRMAKLDGASLIRKLRATLPDSRHVEFIILTGDVNSQLDVQSLNVPILIKPVDTDAFVTAIKAALAVTQ